MIFNLQPLCHVKGCKRGAQIFSPKTMSSGGKERYLKTCVRHSAFNLENIKRQTINA